MKYPLIIDSVSGQQKLGVIKRTGVCYAPITVGGGFDTGVNIFNNTSVPRTVTYAVLGANGSILFGQTTGTIAAYSKLSLIASIDLGGASGLLIAWLTT